jgi:hypothetical protein
MATGSAEIKPLLMIDVDGVISLFGFRPSAPPPGHWMLVDGVAHYLSAHAGEQLRTLSAAFELVWCTGWEEKANDYLPHALGLPGPLPVVSFDRNPGTANAHWKLSAIDAFAGAQGAQRALAWIDDTLDDACDAWAAARRAAPAGTPTLLVATEPAVGLTDPHVATLVAWSRQLS